MKILLATILLLSSLSAFCKQDGEFLRLEQADFPVNSTMLEEMNLTNTSYYSVGLLSTEDLKKIELKSFVELDFLNLTELSKQSYVVSKHAYLVNRAADLWSCALLDNVKYVRSLISPDTHRTDIMKFHVKSKKKFDVVFTGDLKDCTAGLSAEFERKFALLKSLDTEVTLDFHGAFAKQESNFNKGATKTWSLTKIYRMPTAKKEKTLVITYEVKAIPERNMLKNIVISEQINRMDETEAANAKFELENNSGRMD